MKLEQLENSISFEVIDLYKKRERLLESTKMNTLKIVFILSVIATWIITIYYTKDTWFEYGFFSKILLFIGFIFLCAVASQLLLAACLVILGLIISILLLIPGLKRLINSSPFLLKNKKIFKHYTIEIEKINNGIKELSENDINDEIRFTILNNESIINYLVKNIEILQRIKKVHYLHEIDELIKINEQNLKKQIINKNTTQNNINLNINPETTSGSIEHDKSSYISKIQTNINLNYNVNDSSKINEQNARNKFEHDRPHQSINNINSINNPVNRNINHNIVDWQKINELKAQIGLAGELIAIKLEQYRLTTNGATNYLPYIKHSSIIYGDGLGYDIESKDLNGNTIFIEVKSSVSNNLNNMNFTENELNTMRKKGNMYYLYRIYNLNISSKEYEYELIIGKDAIEKLYNFTPKQFVAITKIQNTVNDG